MAYRLLIVEDDPGIAEAVRAQARNPSGSSRT